MEIVLTLIVFIIMIAGKAKEDGYAMGARQRARENGFAYYFDGKNNRETSTNRKCRVDHNEFSQQYRLIDLKNGKILYDYKKEKVIKNNKELKEKGYLGRLGIGYQDYGKITETLYDVLVEASTGKPYVPFVTDSLGIISDPVYRIYYFKDNKVQLSKGKYIDYEPRNIDPNNYRELTKEEYEKYHIPGNYGVNFRCNNIVWDTKEEEKPGYTKLDCVKVFE